MFLLFQVNYKVEFTVIVFEDGWNDVALSKFGENLKSEFKNIGRFSFQNWSKDVFVCSVLTSI